jgi:hypothetical protein
MNLDDLNFRAFYQFYTIGIFLNRCIAIMQHIVGTDESTISDGHNWTVPIYTHDFFGSDNASVPATHMEVDASIFIATHFQHKMSTRHRLRAINIDRKQIISPYIEIVELPSYCIAKEKGWALETMTGFFKPSLGTTVPTKAPYIFDI